MFFSITALVIFLTPLAPKQEASGAYLLTPGRFHWSRQRWLKSQQASTRPPRKHAVQLGGLTGMKSSRAKSLVKTEVNSSPAARNKGRESSRQTPRTTTYSLLSKVWPSQTWCPEKEFGDILRIVSIRNSKKRTNNNNRQHSVRQRGQMQAGIFPPKGSAQTTQAKQTQTKHRVNQLTLTKILQRKLVTENRQKSKERLKFGPWRGKRSLTSQELHRLPMTAEIMHSTHKVINYKTIVSSHEKHGNIFDIWKPGEQKEKDEVSMDLDLAQNTKERNTGHLDKDERLYTETLFDDLGNNNSSDSHSEIHILKMKMNESDRLQQEITANMSGIGEKGNIASKNQINDNDNSSNNNKKNMNNNNNNDNINDNNNDDNNQVVKNPQEIVDIHPKETRDLKSRVVPQKKYPTYHFLLFENDRKSKNQITREDETMWSQRKSDDVKSNRALHCHQFVSSLIRNITSFISFTASGNGTQRNVQLYIHRNITESMAIS